jgi:hypothetical protein
MQFVLSDLITGSSKDLPEDEIDRLFKKLQQHEPSLDIAQQVLARIQQLPGGPLYQSSPAGRYPSLQRPGQQGAKIFH